MTNFEKIRSMTIGELKSFINQETVCMFRTMDQCNHYDSCDDCLIDWLEEEAADDKS